jgi:hypothetical protein
MTRYLDELFEYDDLIDYKNLSRNLSELSSQIPYENNKNQ